VVVGDDVLVAAVVLDPSGSEGDRLPDGTTLRADLLRRVPAHLVPARIAVLDRLPRGADGTPDADAIRTAAAEQAATATQVPPRDDLERVIALVWAEVLGLDEVGVTEEFVALGGDSLLGARLVARLQEELGSDAVSMRALFRAPTVAGLAARIRADDAAGQIDEIGAIVLEIHSLSDEEVAAQLDEPSDL
jgi:mycobactin phenyloxazoline synthetase